MDLKAIRGSFGDYGRIRRGDILKGVTTDHGKKLIAGGAYRAATAEEVERANEKQIIQGLLPSGEGGGADDQQVTTDLTKLTVDQLKAYAAENNIDLGDATKKADLVAAIQLASEPSAN